MAELAKKRTSDGASAATGLKKVSREQQTWRKEFKKDATGGAPAPTMTASSPKAALGGGKGKAARRGPPVLEYRDRGHKWAVENQTEESAAPSSGPIVVTTTDPKQQVYVYKCEGVTVKIVGKVKNVVLDDCVKVGLVFDTAMAACEVVNCTKVQVQFTGTCPSFSIDKTDGCLIYVNKEAAERTAFVTSKSSEMNGEFHSVVRVGEGSF